MRMEDVDVGRARADVEARQRQDLQWLGLTWDEETPRQSTRDYARAAALLAPHTYRCQCTRADIRGRGGRYDGHCRDRGLETGALRLRLPNRDLSFTDRRWGDQSVHLGSLADPVLQRRDGLWAYPLAVVVDDIRDGVTEVVRGADLLDVTAIQVHLWQLFGATPPTWMHTPLVLGHDDKKLSKSHGSQHVGALREAGATPNDIWRRVLPWLGLSGDTLDPAIFVANAGPLGPVRV